MALPHRARTACAALFALAALGAPAAWGACGGGGGSGIPRTAGPIGIVGVVTGSASLCVNGLEIQVDDGTPVTINGRRATPQQLALGQVVAVEARSAGGRLAAQNIAIVRVLEGPVTRVEPAAQMLFVMDQPVRVTDDTMSPGGEDPLTAFRPGTSIQVSGFRNAGGEVVASRIDVAPPRSGHSAVGPMKLRDTRNGNIAGLPVSLADPRSPGQSDVLARGLWDGGALRVGAMDDDPTAHLFGRVEHAVVESLVREARRGNSLRVGNLQVRISRGTRIEAKPDALRPNQPLRVTGVPDRRHGIAAERIQTPPAVHLPALARAEEAALRPPPPSDERARAERERADNPAAARPERMERTESARTERADSSRVERPEAARPEPIVRIERPDVLRLEKPEKPEKVERPERSGSNSGKN